VEQIKKFNGERFGQRPSVVATFEWKRALNGIGVLVIVWLRVAIGRSAESREGAEGGVG